MQELSGLQGSNVAWANQTSLHPVALLALLCLGLATLLLPRRLAIWPFIIMACFFSPAQRLVVAGLDFSMLRILTLFGWGRLLMRGETRGLQFQPIDLAMVAWSLSGTIIYTLQFGTLHALVFRLGGVFDVVGMYFLFRCLIRSWEDLDRTVVGFTIVSIPVALAFLVENMTGRNLFAFLGGVPALTTVRDGRLRCQGAFSSPILAGCFWAAMMPLFAARWSLGGAARYHALTGLGTSLLIVIFCASSTPVMAVILSIVGGAMFWLRHYMRPLRWALLMLMICLHLTMKAPIWHLVARIDLTGSSASWHRYYLMDAAIRHVGEWWLLGTKSTAHWDPLLRDITNHYLLEGLRGGLITMLLFVLVIALAFGAVGRIWRAAATRQQVIMAWALGVAIFVHCMNFIGVAYFGQIESLWYLQLAMVGSLAQARVRRRTPSFAWQHPQARRAAQAPAADSGLGTPVIAARLP